MNYFTVFQLEGIRKALDWLEECLHSFSGITIPSRVPEHHEYNVMQRLVQSVKWNGVPLLVGKPAVIRLSNGFETYCEFSNCRPPMVMTFDEFDTDDYAQWAAGYEHRLTINRELCIALESMINYSDIGKTVHIDELLRRFAVMSESVIYRGWTREWFLYCAALLFSFKRFVKIDVAADDPFYQRVELKLKASRKDRKGDEPPLHSLVNALLEQENRGGIA
ncbi:MAG: hypothetical protein JW904_10810 [Spirochaetales bacterium]|nr:hypothetical protein [Spirochaetales bacterium]